MAPHSHLPAPSASTKQFLLAGHSSECSSDSGPVTSRGRSGGGLAGGGRRDLKEAEVFALRLLRFLAAWLLLRHEAPSDGRRHSALGPPLSDPQAAATRRRQQRRLSCTLQALQRGALFLYRSPLSCAGLGGPVAGRPTGRMREGGAGGVLLFFSEFICPAISLSLSLSLYIYIYLPIDLYIRMFISLQSYIYYRYIVDIFISVSVS